MLCVIGKIDAGARETLYGVQSVVERFELKRRALYGHVTLATFVEGDEDELIKACKDAMAGEKSVEVQYQKITEFDETYIVVALVKKTNELAALQKKAVGDRDKWLDRWTHSADWTPHTTLVHQPGMELRALCDAMQERFQPFNGKIERIEFSRVTEGGYEIVDGFDLKDE